MDNQNEFGARVREWRRERFKTLRETATEAELDYSYLSKIETGSMPPPSEEIIVKIAKALGQEPEELFRLAQKVPQDLKPILSDSAAAPALLRSINGLSEKEIGLLIKSAESMKSDKSRR